MFWNYAMKINPISLDELAILNVGNMKKLRQKCFMTIFKHCWKQKEQISRWAKAVTWVWAIDQTKNLRIKKLKPMHKLPKYQWQPKWNNFFGFLLFSRCSNKVPNGFPTASHFVTFCNVVLSGSYISEASIPTYTFILLEWILLYVEISKALELFICYGPIRPLNEMFEWNPKQKWEKVKFDYSMDYEITK